ncbi:MAG: NADPH-dependent FMN reductase [Pseudomonadota bacterium]
MPKKYKLVGLSGSLRQSATNRKLMIEAARLFDPETLVEGDLKLPLYDGDTEDAEGIPASVQTLADQIKAADAVVISTPEYNKGPSGVLKNALDWVSRTKNRPWMDKPVAVLYAAAGRAGGERGLMILRGLIVPFQPLLLPGPEVHVADSGAAFDAQGRLIDDRYTDALQQLMDKLKNAAGG